MTGTSAAIQSLADDFREPGTSYLSPRRISDILGWSLQGLADHAKVGRDTPTAKPQNEVLQQFLRDILRVLTAAQEMSGDRTSAIYWFMNAPLADFDYRTPEALVRQGEAQVVIDYIDSVSGGATG